MHWMFFLVVIAMIGAVPGLILGPRLLTAGIAALIVAGYAAGVIRLVVWAASCWDCRYEGPLESVYYGRGEPFWIGIVLFSVFIGLILGGLLLGTVVHSYAKSKLTSR